MTTYKLLVERFKEYSDSTLGYFTLYKNGERIQSGYTCEPAGADCLEANKDRRIPEGVYSTKWEWSGMTGNDIIAGQLLPTIYNDSVPASRKIKIHIGNYGKDTEGCLLLGMSCNNQKGYVNTSRAAVTNFLKEVYPEIFEVEITNKYLFLNKYNENEGKV